MDRIYSFFERLKALRPLHKNGIACLLGLISVLALPPISFPLAFLFCFGLFVYLLQSADKHLHAFGLAWFYAFGFHLAGLYWISASLFVDIERYIWVLPFSLIALPCYLALLFGLFAAACHTLREKTILHILALSLALCFGEWVRGTLMGGFPWNLFGYIWTQTASLLQSVSLFGIYGLTLLTLLVAGSFSLIYKRLNKTGLIFIALTTALCLSLALWGEQRLAQHPTAFHDGIHLRLVQPAILQQERNTPEKRLEAFGKIIALSSTYSEKPITHVFWPETASPYFLNQNAQARMAIKHLAPANGALITGTASRMMQQGRRTFYNSVIVMDNQGAMIGSYDKAHLVPFGEFIPFREILRTVPVAADVIGAADFTAGDGQKTLRVPGLPPLSTMICYEAIFSGLVADKKDHPGMLLHVTNDAWFGNTSGPYQHLAMARVRAIEEGLPLIRVANSGISAVIDPLGRIVRSLPLNERGILDSTLPMALEERTPYSK